MLQSPIPLLWLYKDDQLPTDENYEESLNDNSILTSIISCENLADKCPYFDDALQRFMGRI